ncbi:MAG TPA: glycosyltransferase family 2 protein [Puia sp.]|nr:glycosyltransferase family 2 protein [Puia sp.]
MIDEALVSIGVPTYNRPDGLRKALLSITRQTYRNIEVIVSDNCSTVGDMSWVEKDFCEADPRVKFFRQKENKGPTHNFHFVLESASGNYFIWAADDDLWQTEDFLAKLVEHAAENILTFPDAVLDIGRQMYEYPLQTYENCRDKLDYSRVFCSSGEGYPFYGLYNLRLFYQAGLAFTFDTDLKYYGEGTFLHKLFLAGPVKYVKESKILYSVASVKPSYEMLLDNFFEYFRRTILIYSTSDLTTEEKTDLIDRVFNNYTSHIRTLLARQQSTIPFKRRMNKVVKILVKGRI